MNAHIRVCVVGERCVYAEGARTTSPGVNTSDHAGTSNDKTGENPVRRKPKVSWGRQIRPGLAGA